jgi:hypothetical protein
VQSKREVGSRIDGGAAGLELIDKDVHHAAFPSLATALATLKSAGYAEFPSLGYRKIVGKRTLKGGFRLDGAQGMVSPLASACLLIRMAFLSA